MGHHCGGISAAHRHMVVLLRCVEYIAMTLDIRVNLSTGSDVGNPRIVGIRIHRPCTGLNNERSAEYGGEDGITLSARAKASKLCCKFWP